MYCPRVGSGLEHLVFLRSLTRSTPMALQKLAIAIFAYYAAITIQGCGGGDADDDSTVAKTAPTTAKPTTTPAPATWAQNKKYKYTC